jgi:hypothetical protein
VDLLARTCGVDPKTAGRALQELRDLGWLRYSRAKDREGLFVGIVYVLTPPPTRLTSTATHRYRDQIEKRKAKVTEEEARLERGQPEYLTCEELESELEQRRPQTQRSHAVKSGEPILGQPHRRGQTGIYQLPT